MYVKSKRNAEEKLKSLVIIYDLLTNRIKNKVKCASHEGKLIKYVLKKRKLKTSLHIKILRDQN